MKKITLFVITLFVAVCAMAQTPIFLESFGDVGSKDYKYYVDEYTGWDNPNCTFTGKGVSIRMTSSMPTHAWFAKGKPDNYINIAGIVGGKNLSVGFDFAANKGGLTTDELVLTVNGTVVDVPTTTASEQNVFVTVAPIAIADADVLEIKFSVGANGMATEGVRIDNIVVYGEGSGEQVEATAIALDQTTLALEQYREAKLTATLTPANAVTAITFSSDNEEVVKVANNGAVTAVGVGTATITAKAGEFTATCAVTVSEPTVLTCAKAAEYAATVTSGNYEGGKYVIRGYVTEIKEAYNEDYKNISVWMADTKDGGQVFQLFRGKTEGDICEVGDYLEVVGYITQYKGIPETASGAIYKIISDPTAVENVVMSNVYTENGLVVAEGEFAIFTITGQDVTEMNGRLENGVYIVKTANSAVKVVVK